MPKKTKTNQPEKPLEIQGRDLFKTPNYATDLLVPFIPKSITHIWECAAGEGKILNRLRWWGYYALGSDIRENLDEIMIHNFLTDPMISKFDNDYSAIITNPPYSCKSLFFKKCIEYKIPFALLIPTDYCGWIIDAIRFNHCEKIIPSRRIDYIPPSGRGSGAQFHSMWLTWGFNIGKSETFVDLTNEMKKNV